MNSTFIDKNKQHNEVDYSVAEYHQLLKIWREIIKSERQEFLGAYICRNIAKAIGISSSEIDMQQSIQYLGIDSLIAVKLRNKVRTDWLIDLAAVKFLDDFTVGNLVMLADEQIEKVCQQNGENLNSQVINDDDWLEGEI